MSEPGKLKSIGRHFASKSARCFTRAIRAGGGESVSNTHPCVHTYVHIPINQNIYLRKLAKAIGAQFKDKTRARNLPNM